MPARPVWFSKVDAILAALRSIESPWLDRRAIEKLFAVKPRRAQQIMQRLATVEQIGKNSVVSRVDLIVGLEAVARGEVLAEWRKARRRAADEITIAQAEAAAREIPIAIKPDRLKRRLAHLPPTILLTPGRLEIRFRDINDLWSQLAELAGAAAADRQAFQYAAAPPCEKPGNA